MAQRRMFSPQIVDSDAFLDMSVSAQAFYFHLGMRADDDGFVGNPKKILRMIGGNDDDLKILLVKRFLLSFDSGVVVIKHWKIHNLIRTDRYNETKYLEEKNQLLIKENGSYTELHTTRQPDGNQMATQVRLGKVRLGKVNTPTQGVDEKQQEQPRSKEPRTEYKTKTQPSEVVRFIEMFSAVNPMYKVLFRQVSQRRAIDDLLDVLSVSELEAVIKSLPAVNAKVYTKITTPCQLVANLGKAQSQLKTEVAKEQKSIRQFV